MNMAFDFSFSQKTGIRRGCGALLAGLLLLTACASDDRGILAGQSAGSPPRGSPGSGGGLEELPILRPGVYPGSSLSVRAD